MLPQKLVDTAMGGMLMDYLKYLRSRVEQINKQRGRWNSQEYKWYTLLFDWTFIAISPHLPRPTAFFIFFNHLILGKEEKDQMQKYMNKMCKKKM